MTEIQQPSEVKRTTRCETPHCRNRASFMLSAYWAPDHYLDLALCFRDVVFGAQSLVAREPGTDLPLWLNVSWLGVPLRAHKKTASVVHAEQPV